MSEAAAKLSPESGAQVTEITRRSVEERLSRLEEQLQGLERRTVSNRLRGPLNAASRR